MKGLSPCCRKRGDTTLNGLTARFQAATLRWMTKQKGENCLLLVRGIADEWSRTKGERTRKWQPAGLVARRNLVRACPCLQCSQAASWKEAVPDSKNQGGKLR